MNDHAKPSPDRGAVQPCEGTSNPFVSSCGAKFETFEEMQEHNRTCDRGAVHAEPDYQIPAEAIGDVVHYETAGLESDMRTVAGSCGTRGGAMNNLEQFLLAAALLVSGILVRSFRRHAAARASREDTPHE